MKRRGFAKRRDNNEAGIVDELRAAGCTVIRLDKPADLLVGYNGRNYLFEVKNPDAERGKRQALELTEDEAEFHQSWTGQVGIITTSEEAMQRMGICITLRHQM